MARWNKRQEEILFRVYVTDSLQAIAGNVLEISGRGQQVQKRFAEIAYSDYFPQETRTGEEIIQSMKEKLGHLKEGENSGCI